MYKPLLIIFFITFLSCSNNSHPEQMVADSNQNPKLVTNISLIIDSLKSIYAPDKRVALFDIKGTKKGDKVIISGETNLEEPYTLLKNLVGSSSLVDSVSLLPAAEFRVNHYGIINISTCNIRAESRHSSELSTQAILGTPIKNL